MAGTDRGRDREHGRRRFANDPSRLLDPPMLAAAFALMLTPFFASAPQAGLLLAISVGLCGLVLLGLAPTGARSASDERRAALVLASAAGAAWAVVPVLLYGAAQGGARLVLLAAMVGLPAAASICRAGPAFALPAIVGGVWAVAAAGEPSGPMLALLQIIVGLVLVAARRPPTLRHPEPASSTPEGEDLARRLVQDVPGGAVEWTWPTNEDLRLRGDLDQAQARIAHLATHDALTGLANRETFQAHAERACAAAASGAEPQVLLLLDLDGFKQVNDDLGHAIGDELLAVVAQTLAREAPPNAIVARLGGDEFAILFGPGPSSNPETLALAIIRAVSAPFTLGPHQAQIGVSIGIARAPDHATAPRDLTRKADLALYRAKGAGRGRHVVFVEAFERERQERLRMEDDIALALERGEFTLHYQPLLDLAEGRIGACEALIRWTSPTRGSVPPGAFIPAAEGTGLILGIGRFVLARACRDAASWPLPITVAVNISPQHLRSPDFKTDVLAALKASGLPPSRLEIEMTEGVFLDRSSASLDAMIWLRERGIKVALDDFGTGFSSLSYLVDFPVDKIKIDRSFVAGLVGSAKSLAVVDAILTLARTLGVRVVAEGVETKEQALALKLRRCDDLQGYLIERPQPAEAIGRLLVELPTMLRSRVPALLDSSLAAALVMKRSA